MGKPSAEVKGSGTCYSKKRAPIEDGCQQAPRKLLFEYEADNTNSQSPPSFAK